LQPPPPASEQAGLNTTPLNIFQQDLPNLNTEAGPLPDFGDVADYFKLSTRWGWYGMRAWYRKRISDRISENQSDEADSVVFISEEELFNDINLNQDELEGVERLEAFLVCLLGCKPSFGQWKVTKEDFCTK